MNWLVIVLWTVGSLGLLALYAFIVWMLRGTGRKRYPRGGREP